MRFVKSRFVKMAVVFLGLILCLQAAGTTAMGATRKVKIVFFHLSACDGCNDAQKYLADLETLLSGVKDKPDVDIQMVNTFQEGGYLQLQKYFRSYRVPADKQNCPIAFVGDRYLSGQEDITNNLVGAVLNAGPAPETDDGQNQNNSIADKFSSISPLNVFLTGLINGLNPCSMSMLLFFISLLGFRKLSVLKAGIGFCAGKLVAYLFLGIVSFSILDRIDMDQYKLAAKVIVITVAALIAAFNLRDYFAAKNENYEKIRMQLPQALRRINHATIRKYADAANKGALIPVSILLGIFVSLGEFLCTGQIYLATILYVLKENPTLNATALVYFLIYSAAIIIPLLIIVIVVYRGKALFEVSEVIRGRLPLIKLLNAGFFALFGLIAFFLF